MREQPGLRAWHNTWNANREKLRFREQGVEIQGIAQTLEDPSPAIDVHVTRYVNRLVAADAIIEVSARSSKPEAVAAAQRVNDFYYTFLNDMLRQQPGGILAPYRRHIDDMVTYGAGFLRPSFSNSAYELMPNKTYHTMEEFVAELKNSKIFDEGFTENPFVVEAPMLATVAFEPNLSPVCEVGLRTISSLLQAFDDLNYAEGGGFKWQTSDTMNLYDGNWSDTVEFYHLETDHYIYDVVKDTHGENPLLINARPNPASRPWYAMTPGHINNSADYAKRFQPLVAPLYETVQTMNMTRSLLQTGALNTGRPMYQEVADGQRGQDLPTLLAKPVNEQPTLLFDPSEQILKKPRRGFRWELVPTPKVEWVKEANEQSRKDLADWGFPASLSPDSPTTGQANSAAQGAQQMDVATNYLDPALNNVARSLHVLFTRIGEIIIGLDIPITMPLYRRSQGADANMREAVRITPDDFREQDLEVRLESISAASRIAIRESNLRLLTKGLKSRMGFLKAEYTDHLAEAERIQLDKGLAIAEAEALKTFQQFVQENSAAIASELAAKQGIPLPTPPPVVPPSGGPAVPGQPREARPAAPGPGIGAPLANPEQRGPDGVLPSVGEAQVTSAT